MAAELKPYRAYKDSGVEWLGAVPAHWGVERLKGLLANIVDQAVESPHGGTARGTAVALQNVESWTGRVVLADSPPVFDSQLKCFRSGDVLFGRLRPYLAKVTRFTSDGLCVGEFLVLRPRHGSVSGAYFEQLLRSKPIIDAVTASTYGAKMPRADWCFIGGMPVVRPPRAEQAAIVRFLDHADRRIRRYIRAKQQLTALLEEQRRVLVHKAVTRGVKAATRLKGTGALWFPEVPEHWDVMPMRRVIASSLDGPHLSPEYLDQGIPFLSARNIRADRWSLEDVKFISQTDYETFCQRVKPAVGDVLYTKGGTTGIARAVDLNYPFQVWVHVAVLKLKEERILPRFLAAALNSPRCYEQSQLLTRGATNQDLGLGRMKEIVLPVPPLAEQSDIIEHVAEVEDRLGRAGAAALREIELVREYQSRLIADVVTGKVDVRGVGAGRPELDTLVGDHALGGGAPDVVSDSASDIAGSGRDDFENLARDERNGPEEREAQP